MSTPDVKVIAEMLDTLEDAARDVFGNLHPRFLEIRAALCDRVEELEAENAALRARVTGLERDKERLDWLENAFQSGNIVDSSPPLFIVRYRDADGELVDWGELTIRAAADAGLLDGAASQEETPK